MNYISTRGDGKTYSASKVILQGLAEDGGLFVPEHIPHLSKEQWKQFVPMSYQERAFEILSLYLDFEPQDLREAIGRAYHEDKFGPQPAPLVQLNSYSDQSWILELWHGPSSAFKDMALQLLPHLMELAKKELQDERNFCILTATSGDTGKAALEAFADKENFSIIVFYPLDGVSAMQERQMCTQKGDNVHVFGIKGNFDDAQTAVKQAFLNQELRAKVEEGNYTFSSANSINWGRLLAQIVYYASSYLDLLKQEKLAEDEEFDVVVPTGNFGNVLAAWYAKQMGCPIRNFYVASNRNRALSDFLRDGNYDKKRKLQRTSSPSMDILISSNLERLLFEVSQRNATQLSSWMKELEQQGKYFIGRRNLQTIQKEFQSAFADDVNVRKTIVDVYHEYDHVIDPHTAVGFSVYDRLQANNKKENLAKAVFVSTASPFKFPETVADAIFGPQAIKGKSLEELLEMLVEESGLELPVGLANSLEADLLHNTHIELEEVTEKIVDALFGN